MISVLFLFFIPESFLFSGEPQLCFLLRSVFRGDIPFGGIMVREKLVENEHYQLICDRCGKVLAEIHYAGSQYQVTVHGDCEHYQWKSVGNACYENPGISEICRGVEELLEKAEKIYYDGTTVYLLVQR